MKRIILFVIIATFSKVSYSYSYGITGYSGHPSDTTCSTCHYNGADTSANCFNLNPPYTTVDTTVGSFNYSGNISASSFSVAGGASIDITYEFKKRVEQRLFLVD